MDIAIISDTRLDNGISYNVWVAFTWCKYEIRLAILLGHVLKFVLFMHMTWEIS